MTFDGSVRKLFPHATKFIRTFLRAQTAAAARAVLGALGTSENAVSATTATNTTNAGGQIPFPATQNASANANTLDDYDEYTSASTACTGALTDLATWQIVKVGRAVTLIFNGIAGTTTNVASFTYGLTIPAKYRPNQTVRSQSAVTQVAGALQGNTPGVVQVTTSGVITIFRDNASTGWGVAANTGLAYGMSLSWLSAN